MFLERSRHNLLEIHIDNSTNHIASVRNFSKIVAHVNRWHLLDITTRKDSDVLIALLYMLCAPKLEHISMACSLQDDLDNPSVTRIFTEDTPSFIYIVSLVFHMISAQ